MHKEILLYNRTGSIAIDLIRLMALLLILIFVVKVIMHAVLYNRLKRQYSILPRHKYKRVYSILTETANALKLRKTPELYSFGNSKPLIFTIGFFRPAVFITPELADSLTADETRAVLAHELNHIKRRDAACLWTLELFAALIPVMIILLYGLNIAFHTRYALLFASLTPLLVIYFNYFLKQRIMYMREISCDDLTLKIVDDPLLLAQTLIKVWKHGNKLPEFRWQRSLNFVQPFMTASQSVEKRVSRLIDYKKPVLKFLIGRLAPYISGLFIIVSSLFLWQFFSVVKQTEVHVGDGEIRIKIEMESKKESGVRTSGRMEYHIKSH